MTGRVAAILLSVGRIGAGASLLAKPDFAMTAWIGRRGKSPGAAVAGRALGARDLVIGAGLAAALAGGGSTRSWLVAGLLADAVDLAVTVVERDDLPSSALPLIGGAASSGVALGLLGLAAGDGSADSPAPVPA